LGSRGSGSLYQAPSTLLKKIKFRPDITNPVAGSKVKKVAKISRKAYIF
jgi:hypothetical protein